MRCGGQLSYAVGGSVNCHSHFAGNLPRSVKTKIKPVPYDPAIPLLFPRDACTFPQRDSARILFSAALSVIVRDWKQPKHPVIGKWLNKLLYVHSMKYCTGLKKMLYILMWVDL